MDVLLTTVSHRVDVSKAYVRAAPSVCDLSWCECMCVCASTVLCMQEAMVPCPHGTGHPFCSQRSYEMASRGTNATHATVEGALSYGLDLLEQANEDRSCTDGLEPCLSGCISCC